jgi:hypothetical protein
MVDMVIFPSDPLNERRVDPEFANEWQWLQFSGVHRALVNHDELVSSLAASFRMLPTDGGTAVYRGWMVTPEQYAILHGDLANHGITLLTDAEQYRSAHQLPGWVELFKDYTPATTVLGFDPSDTTLTAAATGLGATSFIVKDYVKSRKNEWATACFAPDIAALPTIVKNFRELQDDFLVGGIVVREFVKLDKQLAELRVWWVNGQAVVVDKHPDVTDETVQHGAKFDDFLTQLAPLVKQLGNKFVTTDIAWLADGSPIMIELGDAQVSGLPAEFSEDEYLRLVGAL